MSQIMCSTFPAFPIKMRQIDGDMRLAREKWLLSQSSDYRSPHQPPPSKPVDEPLDFSKKKQTIEDHGDKAPSQIMSYKNFSDSADYIYSQLTQSRSSSPTPYAQTPIMDAKKFTERSFLEHHKSELSRRLTEDNLHQKMDYRQRSPPLSPKELRMKLISPNSSLNHETSRNNHIESSSSRLTLNHPMTNDLKPVSSTIVPVPHNPLGILGHGTSLLQPRNAFTQYTVIPSAMNSMLHGNMSLSPSLKTHSSESGSDRKNNSKPTRPFKAYNPLPPSFPVGLSIMPLGVMQDFEEQEFRYHQFVKQMFGKQTTEQKIDNGTAESRDINVHHSSETKQSVSPSNDSRESPSTTGRLDSSPPLDKNGTTALESVGSSLANRNDDSNDSDSRSGRGNLSNKRGRSLPEELKDAAYWERRRKNNEAAKRSRDSRRQKEDFIAIRARFLEDENKNLRLTNAFLQQQLNTMKCCAAHSHGRF